ncbi:hypothetical protein Pla123a_40600 [Posidoniimonas polymericola]|uniref:YdhG-like domain-containing protein n=1 Tax=Posidoniimonas polymericola TaxID=2528002 RepID=A0A5C5YE72_9BACT|nr:hypothetical protein [Posidoniimonas polymericola]TWT72761.1 hypothetical protein Pla123a_40600 [Posidoniimonas polymericola]
MSTANAKVDDYLKSLKKWRAELTALRRIVLAAGLQEDFKWRQP